MLDINHKLIKQGNEFIQYFLLENNMVIGILFAFKEKEYSIHSPYIRMTWIFFKDYPEDELIDFIQAGADLRHIEDEGIWEYNYEIYVNGAKRVYEDIGRDFNFN